MQRTIRSLAFAVAALAITSQSASAGQFKKAVYYGTGRNNTPYGIISAKFTNSGHLDLALTDYPGSTLSILLGNGDGTFQKPKRFSVPAAFALGSGDFDEDGNVDVAVVESAGDSTGRIQLFLGEGDGKFHAGASFNLGVEPTSISVADLNEDGHLDLVVANNGGQTGDGSVMVFLGTGKGTFKKSATYKISGSPWAVAAGDLNGDHHPDFAVTNISGYVSVLLNDGTGKFEKPVTYNAGGGEGVDVKIGDLRHDGRNDLVVANASLSAIPVLLNKGDGTFGTAELYPTSLPGESTGADGVVIADFNMDGKLDLAASNQDGNSALFYGKGDGTFKAAIPIHDEIKFDGAFGLAVGDFNNDQAPDLAFAMYFKPKVAIMLNTK